jgi:hypothetical protein
MLPWPFLSTEAAGSLPLANQPRHPGLKPDWEPFLAGKAPEGSPNGLIILSDDTGLAAWSPIGTLGPGAVLCLVIGAS